MFLSRARFCRSRWQSSRLGALFWCLEFRVYKSYKVWSLELSSEAVGSNPGCAWGSWVEIRVSKLAEYKDDDDDHGAAG